jgi:hypothetical protein
VETPGFADRPHRRGALVVRSDFVLRLTCCPGASRRVGDVRPLHGRESTRCRRPPGGGRARRPAGAMLAALLRWPGHLARAAAPRPVTLRTGVAAGVPLSEGVTDDRACAVAAQRYVWDVTPNAAGSLGGTDASSRRPAACVGHLGLVLRPSGEYPGRGGLLPRRASQKARAAPRRPAAANKHQVIVEQAVAGAPRGPLPPPACAVCFKSEHRPGPRVGPE